KTREEQIAVLKKEMASAQEQISRLEAEGWKVAAAKTRGGTNVPGPVPFAQWSFDGKHKAVLPGELKGGAKITNGNLVLPKEGAFYQTASLPRDIREKT